MPLDQLLGNEQLKQQLAPVLAADRLSHAYLITGPEGSGRHTLARLLAAAMQCTAGASRPCCVCPQCRKVLSGQHPDVVTVDDPEHKNVSIKLVRDARGDLFVRPNEGRRKVYLYPRAADLNAAGQNALLKVLEEPPRYGAFLLLATGAAQLLPTIRSRCVELRLAPLSAAVCAAALRKADPTASAEAVAAACARSGGFLGQAKQLLAAGSAFPAETLRFAEAYAAADRLALTMLLVPLERKKADYLQELFSSWAALLSEALQVKAGTPSGEAAATRIAAARSGAALLEAVRHLQRACRLLEGNVSPAAICGALQVYLK